MKDKETIKPLCEGWQDLNSCKTCKNTECDNNTSKEKQIEEMAKIIDDRLIEARGYLGSMNKGEGYWIAQKLIEHYQPIIDKDSVVLTREEYEKLKTQLRIKTNEAEWRADQLQALDKDFELLEKVVKCKDCKWLEEKHYEEDNEKPYIKLVCKLTKRQCRLYDFCSYGESKV